jgi:uncharacterized RDD family membrane protein YckC
VKCPKCGFVSFPGLRQCRKCGSSLEPPSDASNFVPPAWDELEDDSGGGSSQFVSGSGLSSDSDLSRSESSPALEKPSTVESGPATSAGASDLHSHAEETTNAAPSWASELSERVATFRRRKQAAPNPAELELTLPFKAAESVSTKPPIVLPPSWRQGLESKKSKSSFDLALDEPGTQGGRRQLDSLPFSESRAHGSAEAEPEITIEPLPETRRESAKSLESDFSETVPIPASDFAEIRSAPLGKRFMAGIIDGLVLVVAASVFAIIAQVIPILFGLSGGHIQLDPWNLALLIFLASFWIFAYFAAFSALASSTPGQAMMGLVVLNFDGALPTRQECLLRAFGYLVSIASVMLGFLWAAMDSDGLAWHDHISGTYLGELNSAGG